MYVTVHYKKNEHLAAKNGLFGWRYTPFALQALNPAIDSSHLERGNMISAIAAVALLQNVASEDYLRTQSLKLVLARHVLDVSILGWMKSTLLQLKETHLIL